jgi:hypothetical protein
MMKTSGLPVRDSSYSAARSLTLIMRPNVINVQISALPP